MQKILTFLLVFLLTQWGWAQKNHTLSGYVKDIETGELLAGATIAVPLLETGAYSNAYGFYSLTLPAQDTILVVISYVGYTEQFKKVVFQSDIALDVLLQPAAITADEVVITDNKARQNIEKPTMGVIDIPIEQVEMIPYIGGEKDLMKAIQLLPGVQGGSEASSGYYVRGGQADQNLVLMDEAVVYNPFHLAGYLGVFNADAIRNITLYKGSFPAQYGGRLSSILDIQMKEGNQKKWGGQGGLGLISAHGVVEGPIIKDKMSVMVSARRLYWDLMIRPFLPKGTDFGYTFYDLNAKWNWKISNKDRVYLSGYFGKDNFYSSQMTPVDTTKFGVYWGNKTFTARWNHLFNNKLFSNTSFVYNDYLFNINTTQQGFTVKLMSGIKDINGKIDFDYFPNPRHKVKFGLNYTYHTFVPSSVRGKVETIEFGNIQSKYVHESAAYINDEIVVTDKIGLNVGLRAPFFVYKTTRYYGLEPRATFKYQLNANTSIKGGYTMMKQFVSLISSSSISLPFDLWVPATDTVKPQIAHQAAVGVFQNLFQDRYESSVELYYKHMSNQIDYREGANFFFNSNYQKELVFGKAWSYGAEFFMRKRTGRLTGWLSYTLSWTWRQFDDLNQGKAFPFKYDRRHNLSLVAIYKFNKRWSFSSVFVYNTGSTLTLPDGKLYVPLYGWIEGAGGVFSDYVSKNGYRLRAYNRVDIGLRYDMGWKKFDSEIHIDIYNVYNRRNPFFVYMAVQQDNRSGGSRYVAKQVSLLPMIPTVTWQFKF